MSSRKAGSDTTIATKQQAQYNQYLSVMQVAYEGSRMIGQPPPIDREALVTAAEPREAPGGCLVYGRRVCFRITFCTMRHIDRRLQSPSPILCPRQRQRVRVSKRNPVEASFHVVVRGCCTAHDRWEIRHS